MVEGFVFAAVECRRTVKLHPMAEAFVRVLAYKTTGRFWIVCDESTLNWIAPVDLDRSNPYGDGIHIAAWRALSVRWRRIFVSIY